MCIYPRQRPPVLLASPYTQMGRFEFSRSFSAATSKCLRPFWQFPLHQQPAIGNYRIVSTFPSPHLPSDVIPGVVQVWNLCHASNPKLHGNES
jgi:hypothetical protein